MKPSTLIATGGMAGALFGAVLQGVALMLVFGSPSGPSWAIPIALHIGGGLLAAEALWRLLPASPERNPRLERAAFALATLFVPVGGTLGLALGAIAPMRYPRPQKPSEAIRVMAVPALPARAVMAAEAMVAQGSLFGKIRNATNLGIRLRAVMATRQMADRAAVPILRLALRDPSDEVRLLAYAILDSREGIIYRRINELLQELPMAPAKEKPGLHQQLAEEYWELAYQGLAQGELFEYVLTEARKHVETAITADANNGGLVLQLGRICLAQKAYPDAQVCFTHAQALGLPARVINLYQAEVAFAERKFGRLREMLGTLGEEATRRPVVQQIAEYWR